MSSPKLFTLQTAHDKDVYDPYDPYAWIENLRCEIFPETPRMGDMVRDESCGNYRDEGMAIFDGAEWQLLHDETNGSLPPYISYPQFALGSHLKYISYDWISWITIDAGVVQEISQLHLAYKYKTEEDEYSFWHIVGSLLGKQVDWELDEVENDDEDDTDAEDCLKKKFAKLSLNTLAISWLCLLMDAKF